MLLRLGFSQMVAHKLVDDKGIDTLWTLASLFDEDITTICDVIKRPGGLVSSKMPDRMDQISILAVKNLKHAAFIFKGMEHFSKPYGIQPINGTSMLKYQHQWELEKEKPDDMEAPKVDKNSWANTMEKIVLHLKLVR